MKQNAGILFHGDAMGSNVRGAYDDEGRRKYLSRAEGCKFIGQAARLPRPEALFCLTIYYTGCRISEALALRSDDIDPDANVIRIRSLKKRGKQEVRRLPIPSFIVAGLLTIAPKEGRGRLWRFSRTTGWRVIKRVMSNAEISGIHATTKGLRHGFGVRGAMMRIPVNLIQQWLGHADSSTTAIYLVVKDDEERELIEKTW